jgi:hypothetical protein
MKRFSILLGLALATLSMLATVRPARAEERPFNTMGAGNVSNDMSSLFAGGIKAMHLGHCYLSVDTDPYQLDSGFFIPYGGGMLRSASGDILYFDFDAERYIFDPVIGVLNVTVLFTGGTGRFQDATGSADMMFVFDPTFHHFLFLIDGSIDY